MAKKTLCKTCCASGKCRSFGTEHVCTVCLGTKEVPVRRNWHEAYKAMQDEIDANQRPKVRIGR